MSKKSTYFVITDGPNTKFRPSNWNSRLACHFATFDNRRLVYSPDVYPATVNRANVVIVNQSLKYTNPNGYCMLMDFVHKHSLTTKTVELPLTNS